MTCFESGDGALVLVDTNQWVAENERDFAPPVCNKCMFADQLKVFFVGGPNSRRDYHLEEGEELFYQIKGDMTLKVIEQGRPRDIHIREGEMFLLPARVEHSPQRFAGTLGCVVERERAAAELDCVRYFVDDTATNPEVLWERWFHLNDVVADLPPVIAAFNASQAKQTGRPDQDSLERPAPFSPVQRTLPAPVNLAQFVDSHLDEIRIFPYTLFEEGGARVTIYGEGSHELQAGPAAELLILFERGEGTIKAGGQETSIRAFQTARVRRGARVSVQVKSGVFLGASIA